MLILISFWLDPGKVFFSELRIYKKNPYRFKVAENNSWYLSQFCQKIGLHKSDSKL